MSETTFDVQLQTFQQNFDALIATAKEYPPDLRTIPGVTGDWSAREVIAHINGWLVEAQRRFPRYAKGTGNIDYNIDVFDAVSIRMRKDNDFEQILDETVNLVSRMTTIANEIPGAYKVRDTRYGEWLDTLSEEAGNHSEELRAFLEGK